MVTVVYEGKGQPGPFERQFRLKDLVFISGKEETISPEQAGLLLASAPKGTVTVKSGTPAAVSILPNSAKAAAKRAEEQRKRFPVDPAGALQGLEAIPADALKVLGGEPKAAVALVEGGKVDACLGSVAIWAQLGGKVEIAQAAARRAEAIRPKA